MRRSSWSLSRLFGRSKAKRTSKGGSAAISRKRRSLLMETLEERQLLAIVPPVITGLTSTPEPAVQGGAIALQANGVTGDNGVASVAFYRDANGNGAFDPGVDQLLGTDTNGANGWAMDVSTANLSSGTQTFFAQATDDQGLVSNVVTTTATVEYAATLDNSQSGYSESGAGWSTKIGSQDYLGDSRQHTAGSGNNSANWQFSNLPATEYTVYATWSAASGQASNAPFTVYDGSVAAGTERVDQQAAPSDLTFDGQVWQAVGTYFISNGQMTVTLSDDADGTVAADAIRIVDSTSGTLTWDPGHNGGGSGTWNTTTANWWNGHADVAWANGSAAVFGSSGGTVTISGTVTAASVEFSHDGYTLSSGTLAAGTSLSISVDNSGDTAVISSTLTGSGGDIKNGSGTLKLAGNAMPPSGALTVNAGTLQAGNSGTLCNSLTLGTSGTLDLNSYSVTVGSLSGSSNATVTDNSSGTTVTLSVGSGGGTFSGTIHDGNGTVALAKTSGGTLTLTGTNLSYTGDTTVTGGTLQIGDGTTSNGTLPGTSPNVSVSSGAVLAFDPYTDQQFSGVISGAGGLTKNGPRTLTLEEANNYSGPTMINAGTLVIGAANAIPSAAGNVTVNGTLDLYGHNLIVSGFSGNSSGTVTSSVPGSNGDILFTIGANGGGGSFAGVIEDGSLNTPLDLVKSGTGTITLSNANRYRGTTTIAAGVLEIQNVGALGSTDAGTTVESGATLGLNCSSTSNEPFAEPLILNGQGTSDAPGALISYRNIDAVYAGSITLGSDATIIGGAGGTLAVDNSEITGSGNLTVDCVGDVTIASTITTGSGGLTVEDSGTLTLSGSGVNTYTGDTTIDSDATLKVDNTNALAGSTVDYESSGGSLVFDTSVTAATFGGLEGNQNLALTNSGNGPVALTVGGDNADTTYFGILSGGNGLTKVGTGTLTLSGVNSYAGTTTISEGVLQADDGEGLPSSSFLSLAGGVLQSNSSTSFTRGLGTSGDTFQWTGSGGGFAAGGGDLTVNVGGDATPESLTWGTNPGSSIVGTLILGSSTAAGVVTFQNPINLGNSTQTIEVDANTASATNSANLPGVISGDGSLTKTGDGTLVLAGNCDYGGTTTISAGTLQINNWLVQGDIVDNGTLTFDIAAQGWLNCFGAISGEGNLVKEGEGTLSLLNANTYSGGTIINAGSVEVGDIYANSEPDYVIGTGPVVVNFNSSLEVCNGDSANPAVIPGNITSNGTIEIGAYAVLTGDNSSCGGTITLDSGSVLSVEDGGTSGTFGSGSLTVTGSGTLAFNSSNDLAMPGAICGSVVLLQEGSSSASYFWHDLWQRLSYSRWTGHVDHFWHDLWQRLSYSRWTGHVDPFWRQRLLRRHDDRQWRNVRDWQRQRSLVQAS